MPDEYSKYFQSTVTTLEATFNGNNEGYNFDFVLPKAFWKTVSEALSKNRKLKESQDLIKVFKYEKCGRKTNKVICETITTDNIKEYLDVKMYAKELKNAFEGKVIQERKENNLKSESTAAVGRELSKVIRIPFELALPATSGEYNDKDEELFSWFAVDDNPEYNKKNLFMKDKSGKYLPIYFNKVANGYRAEFDTQAFHDAHRDDYIRWANDAASAYMSLRDIAKSAELDYSESDISDMLEEIHKVLPKAIMHECKLEVCYTANKDNDPIFNSVKLRLNYTDRNKATWEETNIADMMSTVIPRLNKNKMQVIKRYSTDLSTPAILRLPVDYINSLISTKSPLPPIWREFLSSKFTIDRDAQLYRIAKFMTSVIDQDNRSRQMLCLADKGHSGKSTFINAIQKGLNRLADNCLFAKQANTVSLTNPEKSQEGLEDIMDSRLVIATEVNDISKFVDAPAVKNLTGGDTVVAGVKYGKPVYKNMAGTKIIICTNNWVNVKNKAIETRIIPIVFESFNGTPIDDLSNKLADSIEGFLAWCKWWTETVETKRGYKNRNHCDIFSDNHPEFTTKEVFQNLQSDGQIMFRYKISDEYNELDENYMLALCETIHMTAGSDTDFVEYKDLMEGLQAANKELGCSEFAVKPLLNPRSKDYKALKDFLKDKYNATSKLSHGITKIYGIKLDTGVAEKVKREEIGKSHRASDFLKSEIPKKEPRGGDEEYDPDLEPDF